MVYRLSTEPSAAENGSTFTVNYISPTVAVIIHPRKKAKLNGRNHD